MTSSWKKDINETRPALAQQQTLPKLWAMSQAWWHHCWAGLSPSLCHLSLQVPGISSKTPLSPARSKTTGILPPFIVCLPCCNTVWTLTSGLLMNEIFQDLSAGWLTPGVTVCSGTTHSSFLLEPGQLPEPPSCSVGINKNTKAQGMQTCKGATSLSKRFQRIKDLLSWALGLWQICSCMQKLKSPSVKKSASVWGNKGKTASVLKYFMANGKAVGNDH